MGKDNDTPPPPDYSGMAAASQASAKYAYDLGKEQLAWAKEQFAGNKEITDRVISLAMDRAETQDAQAARDRARYEGTFQPLEDELVRDSREYSSEGRQDREAGAAMRDVSAQFQLARTAAQERLESFGIDPSQTRATALDLNARIAEATARASAGTNARERVEGTGRALRSDAINIGRGYPGQAAQLQGLAAAGGQGAVSAGLQTTASGSNTMGTPIGWQGAGTASINSGVGAFNGQAQANDAWRNQTRKDDQALWGGIGKIGGIGLNLATGGMSGMFGFEEGGLVPEEMPIEGTQITRHQGVPIDDGMSPSGGRATDDVSAMVNAGEFIVPEDVVRWKGEEFFQRTIKSSREAKQDPEKAPAKPKMGAVPVGAMRPAVQTSALPV